MGAPDLKKKKNILHLVEFLITVIDAICLADVHCIKCGKHLIQYQFITSSAYAPLLVMSLIFLGMFLDEELPEKMDIGFSIVAGVMCIASGIIGIIYATDNENRLNDDQYYRILVGGIFFVINAVLFIVEFFLLLFKKDALE